MEEKKNLTAQLSFGAVLNYFGTRMNVSTGVMSAYDGRKYLYVSYISPSVFYGILLE